MNQRFRLPKHSKQWYYTMMNQHRCRSHLQKLLLILLPIGSCGNTTGENQPDPRCNNNTPLYVDGQPTGFASCEGIVNRPQQASCPLQTPRSGVTCQSPEDNNECFRDDECTDHPNGFCALQPSYPGEACACVYSCTNDSECGPDAICECGSSFNMCVWAQCRINDDCQPNMLCAPSEVPNECYTSPQYDCQSPDDRCRTNADCVDFDTCGFDYQLGHRICSTVEGFSCGRPFRIIGQLRIAPWRYQKGSWNRSG